MTAPISAIIAVAACVLLSACGSSGNGGPAADNTGGSPGSPGGSGAAGLASAQTKLAKYEAPPTHIAQTVPLKTAPPTGKTIVYLVQGSVPSVVRVGDGAKAAAAAAGWKFVSINYDPASPASLQAAFSSALLKHPTVVGVTGTDPSLYGASVIAQFKSAGIPIIVSDVGAFTSSKLILGDPGGLPSLKQEADALASWFVVDSKGKGHALWASQSSFSSMVSLHSYFMDDVKSMCPGCKVTTVNVTLSQLSAGTEPAAVVTQLRQHTDIKYALFDDGAFAGGISAALASAGLNSIKVAGCDIQPDGIAGLKSGTQSAWTGVDTTLSGYGISDLAFRYVEGMPTTTADDLRPTQVLTKSNIGSTKSWTVPFDALSQYKTLWKIS